MEIFLQNGAIKNKFLHDTEMEKNCIINGFFFFYMAKWIFFLFVCRNGDFLGNGATVTN